jgi:phenylalanyl-tRNA synthetase beta chain
MRISLNWLSDYIETGLDAESMARILSDQGLPCEGVERLADDTVIDVEVTSNRGDCLSHIGIARELAAATGKPLRLPQVEFDEMDKPASEFVQVEIREPDLCGRYTGRVIEGVKIGPSPDWIVKRLEAVGMRGVNNVVDATNYAMMETGQPPHAFDYATIEGRKIVVRKAATGEQIVSIDGTECALTPEMLVIADARRPVAVAGIMGGLATEVNDATTTILLEDAYFDPLCIRRTSRRLVLPSEASFRFERIVDIQNMDWASRRTAQLIVELAGGCVAKGVVDAYPRKPQPQQVAMRLSRLSRLLGIEVATDEAMRILAGLCFEPRLQDGSVVCSVPSWRSDISREVDLIEEVARVHGYSKVPTRTKIQIEATPADPRHAMAQRIGTILDGCGFYETINVDFVDQGVADLFSPGGPAPYLAVRQTAKREGGILRRTLLGSLLHVLKTNVNAKNLPCRVYEIADTFIPTGDRNALPDERAKLGLVVDEGLRLLRGAIEAVVANVNRNATVEFVRAELGWAEVGASVLVDGKEIGQAGIFSEAVRQKLDFKELTPCGAELAFEALMALKADAIKIKPIPRFPAIERDLSIVLADETPWSEIAKAVQTAAPAELESVQFVDIYRGKGVPSGKKSLTLSLRFRDEDGTLTHDTVDNYQARILDSLKQGVSAELRT